MNEVNPVKSFNYSGRVKKHYIRTPPFTILILILTSWDYRMSTPSVSGHHVVHILMMITNSTKNSKLCKKCSGARNHYTFKKTKTNKHYRSFYIFKTKIKDCTRITHKISTWQIVASSHFAQWFSLCLWQQVQNKTKNRIRMRNRNWDLDTVPFIFIFVNFKKRKHLYPKILPQQL